MGGEVHDVMTSEKPERQTVGEEREETKKNKQAALKAGTTRGLLNKKQRVSRRLTEAL